MAEVRSQPQRTERNWAAICCSAFACLQLYWVRLVLRKWLNVSSTESDYSADTDDDVEDRVTGADNQVCDPCRSGVTKDGYSGADNSHVIDGPKLRRRNSETFRAQYMDTKAIRVCAGTWNVGGKVPPADLDINGWLDTVEPADIYVLGLQEIVPLNAGNIFGMENDQPASEWENIIRDALNRVKPRKLKIVSHSGPPSPSNIKPDKPVPYSGQGIFVESKRRSMNKKPNSSETADGPLIGKDASISDSASCLPIQEYLQTQFSSPKPPDQLLSVQINSVSKREERVSRWSTFPERVGLIWPEPPLRLLNQYALERRGTFKPMKPLKTYNSFQSSIIDVGLSKRLLRPGLDFEPLMNSRRSSYVRIVSKQMVGVFLTIWVRRSLRRHIRNVSVSTVGVGIMGYIGNKGSVSVSMSIYHTPFCFLCTHLTSGEKEEEHQKRNADVCEIHRRTQFHPHSSNDIWLPRSIRDHERIIWLGDLNYRINLSYEKTHELIARKEWQMLLEKDQLSSEMRKGHVFEGWSEGALGFPPTYKYEINSENYIGDDLESGKRKPAWCDRIIWKGKGMKLLSYRRSELKLSDHRPVTATFLAEIEVLSPRKLQRALNLTYAEIQSQDA